MDRYLIFFGSNYYPFGGMSDFLTSADTLEKAKEIADKRLMEDFKPEYGDTEEEHRKYEKETSWCHIWDSKDNKVVWQLNECDYDDFSTNKYD